MRTYEVQPARIIIESIFVFLVGAIFLGAGVGALFQHDLGARIGFVFSLIPFAIGFHTVREVYEIHMGQPTEWSCFCGDEEKHVWLPIVSSALSTIMGKRIDLPPFSNVKMFAADLHAHNPLIQISDTRPMGSP